MYAFYTTGMCVKFKQSVLGQHCVQRYMMNQCVGVCVCLFQEALGVCEHAGESTLDGSVLC